MMFRSRLKLFIFVLILSLLFVPLAFAETKVFEKEVEEIVGRDQSQEQVEAFALQKAKRLAVEEAGTFISSLTIVKNHMLEKDEITALASGIVQAKVVGIPSVEVKNGVIHVKVKARIETDTSILDRQIEEIMKEKGTLKRLEEERQKVKNLENQLANLKSSEVKRLEELNAQALALERERERQRLILEEQSLKAKGELKRVEIERLQNEREMQERMAKILAEQEKARKEEVEALAREQDRLRRAQLENEQRWNELARNSKLRQAEWIPIDDSLSLKQAIEEAKQLKAEITTLKGRLDLQFVQNKRNLEKAFEQQIDLSKPKLPPSQKEKDPFETTEEYNKRIRDYQAKVGAVDSESKKLIRKIKTEENWRTTQVTREYYEQTIKILDPFIKRLQALQQKKFAIPEEAMTVEVGDPEADRSRFPLLLKHEDQSWNTFWEYSDRDKARDFWKTRSYLKTQALYQLEDQNGIRQKLTAAKVTHLGSNETRDFVIASPQPFKELSMVDQITSKDLPEIKEKEAWVNFLYLYDKGITSNEFKEPFTNMKLILVKGGCFDMGVGYYVGYTEQVHKVCVDPFYIGVYEVTQAQWEKVMGRNPSRLKKGGNYPVDQVRWNEVQNFLERVSQEVGLRFRLPTENEWEYAAKSGGKRELFAGTNQESELSNYAWYNQNSMNGTHPVGEKRPNRIGLYDMSGNVAEWCADWYDNLKQNRVARGGFWASSLAGLRTSRRGWVDPGTFGMGGIGFRVALSVP
jgi:formylglycine-generating enzyme required for sulfatase activity